MRDMSLVIVLLCFSLAVYNDSHRQQLCPNSLSKWLFWSYTGSCLLNKVNKHYATHQCLSVILPRPFSYSFEEHTQLRTFLWELKGRLLFDSGPRETVVDLVDVFETHILSTVILPSGLGFCCVNMVLIQLTDSVHMLCGFLYNAWLK